MRTLSYSLDYIRRDPDMVQAHALAAWLAEHFLAYAQDVCDRESASVVAHVLFVYAQAGIEELAGIDYRMVVEAAQEVDRYYNLIDMSSVTQKQALVLGKLCFVSVLQILAPQWVTG